MVKLTQLILHFGDEMNVEQKRYGYGPSKYPSFEEAEKLGEHFKFINPLSF